MPRLAQQRLPFLAGISRVITSPPGWFRNVTISNAGTQDLLVYTTEGDDSTTVAIAAGWERTITLPSEGDRFRPGELVCWVKSSADGTVVLIWI